MHQQRWHHRYSLVFFCLPPVFLLSHHPQSSSAFIFPVCSSAPFRSSSSLFFICCQMIFETSLIPRLTPSSFPPVDLSVSLYSWLSAFFSLSLILMLIWLPFSHSVFLFCSYSLITLHVFFSISDLSILFWSIPIPIPILFPLIQSSPNFSFICFSAVFVFVTEGLCFCVNNFAKSFSFAF